MNDDNLIEFFGFAVERIFLKKNLKIMNAFWLKIITFFAIDVNTPNVYNNLNCIIIKTKLKFQTISIFFVGIHKYTNNCHQ